MPGVNHLDPEEARAKLNASSPKPIEQQREASLTTVRRQVAAIAQHSPELSKSPVYRTLNLLSHWARTGNQEARAVAIGSLLSMIHTQHSHWENALQTLVTLSFDPKLEVRTPALNAWVNLPEDDVLVQIRLGHLLAGAIDPPACSNWLFVSAQNLASQDLVLRSATSKCLLKLSTCVGSSKQVSLYCLAEHGFKSSYQDVHDASIDLMVKLVELTNRPELISKAFGLVSKIIEDELPSEVLTAAKLLKELARTQSHQAVALSLIEDLVFIAEDKNCPEIMAQLAQLTYDASDSLSAQASGLLRSFANHDELMIRVSALEAIEDLANSSSSKRRTIGMENLKKIMLNNPKARTIDDACTVLSRLVQSDEPKVRAAAFELLTKALDDLSDD